jgi:hypothetical protein
MTIPEKVFEFLVDQRPRCFCDDCIQRELGLARRQEVAPVTKTLGLTSAFRREPGCCASGSHSRIKLVICVV